MHMSVRVLSMCHIPFLKDALYLRPETEAVEKLLEGLPREVIWLESLRLEENREDCVDRYGREDFRDTLIESASHTDAQLTPTGRFFFLNMRHTYAKL